MLGTEWATLTDPVCGRSVEADSPFRCIHGGALFAFCSPACRAQFVALPSRYAVIANAANVPPPVAAAPAGADAAVAPAVARTTAAASATPAVVATRRAEAPAVPAAPAVATPSRDTAPAAARGPAEPQPPAAASAQLPTPPAPPADARAPAARRPDEAPPTITWDAVDLASLAGAAGPFSWLLAWRERRFASECAHTLMKIHQDLSTRYPELQGEVLYRRVVATHLGGDHSAVAAVLRFAHQSFAIWPTERALNFRDVVHYLAVSQFMAEHGQARWVYADMKRIVNAIVPANL